MSDYLLMLRFDILKLKNCFLEVQRTPKKLVSYVLFLGWLSLIIVPGLMNRANKTFDLASETIEKIMGVYAILITITIIIIIIFIQLLSVLIPSVLVGGVIFLLSHSVLLAGLGIMLANIGVGALFLFMSEKIVCYIELREFSND
jgi:hypothetical protein